jgi:hypothetical protein
MLLEGVVKNGTIELEKGQILPEGVRVEVTVKDMQAKKPQLTHANLLSLAGIAKNLPADFAEQHDHYIHGTDKR